jgi:hypothetical protein
MDDFNDPCKKLSLWAQYGPTCWFNAVLTTMYHSQYSRNMLLKIVDKWKEKKTTLQQLTEYIVKHKYIKSDNLEKDRIFFYKVKPERILSFLHKKYPKYFKLNTGNYGGFSHIILNKMYKILGLKCLMFDIIKEDNLDYICYDKYNHFEHDYNIEGNNYNYYPISKIKLIKILEERNKNPDVLIINLNNSNISSYLNKDYEHYHLNSPEYSLFDENINEIKSLKDNIIYNGYTYILDSVILVNYNYTISNHAIAGITCNNQRYVYNGWTKYTDDPALQNKNNNNNNDLKEKIKEVPCEIIKFPWDIKTSSDFCINLNECNLPSYVKTLPRVNSNGYIDSIKPSNILCFNFSEGSRTLVYIKQELSTGTLNFNTQKFKRFYVPEDLHSIYNRPITIKPYNINTSPIHIIKQDNINIKSDDLSDIIKNIIKTYDKRFIILEYSKKYIYKVNNDLYNDNINLNIKFNNLLNLKNIIIIFFNLLYYYAFIVPIINDIHIIDELNQNFLNYFQYDENIYKTLDHNKLYIDILNNIKKYLNNNELSINIEKLLKDLELYYQSVLYKYKLNNNLSRYIKFLDSKILFNNLFITKNNLVEQNII